MEWWVPFAVVAAALAASMIAPLPRPRARRRADDETRAGRPVSFNFKSIDDEPPAARADDVQDDDLEPSPPPPRRPRQEPPPYRALRPKGRDLDDEETPGLQPVPAARSEPRKAAPKRVNGGSDHDVRRTPVSDQPSYFRDPTSLEDWPQKDVVEDTVRVFLDRWGGEKALTTFRQVEAVPASNERNFVFLLAVEPERRGKETTILARVSIPGENAGRPSRFKATKYFDHMGERFREDVAKTPQHSRGVITVRDVPAGEDGKAAVALDYEAPLKGDPYDDIRSDDVAQYKNLLNIMRMFA